MLVGAWCTYNIFFFFVFFFVAFFVFFLFFFFCVLSLMSAIGPEMTGGG